jgi:hypothetical protein
LTHKGVPEHNALSISKDIKSFDEDSGILIAQRGVNEVN